MKSCRTCISAILTICLIIAPLFCYAQRSRTTETEQEDSFEAQRAGIADAKNDASCPMWFSLGFFLNIIGVGAANLIVPGPSHERVIGKSMEYVWTYTESYKSTRRTLQTRYALFGCLTGGIVVAVACGLAAQQAGEDCSSFDWSCGTNECSDNWDQCNQNWSECNDNWEGCNTSDGGCSSFEGCGGSDSSCGSFEGCGGSDSSCGSFEGCGGSDSSCGSSDGCGGSSSDTAEGGCTG